MSSPSYQRLVDDGSGRPLYDRVYRVIADAIERGDLAPGDRIPAERALCEQLGVSRVTVRRAFRRLAEDGLIVSGVGRGSFVSQGAPVGEPPDELMSFREMGRGQGFASLGPWPTWTAWRSRSTAAACRCRWRRSSRRPTSRQPPSTGRWTT